VSAFTGAGCRSCSCQETVCSCPAACGTAGAWAGVAVPRTRTGASVSAPTIAPPVSLALRVMLLTAMLNRGHSFFQTPTGLADGFGLEVALRHIRPLDGIRWGMRRFTPGKVGPRLPRLPRPAVRAAGTLRSEAKGLGGPQICGADLLSTWLLRLGRPVRIGTSGARGMCGARRAAAPAMHGAASGERRRRCDAWGAPLSEPTYQTSTRRQIIRKTDARQVTCPQRMPASSCT